MDILYHAMLVFIFLIHWIGSGVETNTVLTHVPVEVDENSNVVLSCYSTYDPINGVMSWRKNDLLYTVNLTDNLCRAITYPLNRTDRYTLNCSDIHNISLTIRNVDRLQHGDRWQCLVGFARSNVLTLYVKVPVVTLDLTFTDHDFRAENQTSHFQCKSSFSRPKPDIYWFLSNGTPAFNDDERLNSNINVILVNKTVGNRTDNILTSTESELVLKVQRTMNNQQIYCLTHDTSGRVLRSTLVTLNISYHPDGPPYIRGTGNNVTYSIINTFQGNMTCIVTGGNPLPNLDWTCFQNGTQTTWISNTSVINDFTWIASVDNNKMMCTCKSLYLGGQSSASVRINVLYPPSLPEFYIHSKVGSWQKVSSEINIRENNSLTIKCSSESNPISTFSWTGPSSSNNELLKLNVTYNRTKGSYICTARNIMTQTNGTSLEGTKNNSIRVNVLYPPSDITFTIRNQSTDISVSKIVNVIENNPYILTCYARGNPAPTYSWTGPVKVSSDTLHFTNINRNNAGYYTCVAKNTINESTGTIYNEQENKTIYLNIQYASEVTDFFVAGHEENNLAITYQKETATFHCNVDSKPSSAIGLQFNEWLLISNTNAMNLSYSIMNLTCSNAGIYYCYSSNKINNGKRSRKQLTIIVKCPPLPEKDLNFHVTTLKYVPATLWFKAMDYLDTRNTSFTWQREISTSQWETIKNDTQNVKISTFNLQTNLTILNVSGSYSGKYRVVYNNSVGGNTQSFELSVADLPDPPTNFDYLKESVTSTHVTVVWKKGNSGGLRQTFVLNISQTSQHIKYNYINETENEHMQHTITGLSSGTRYFLTLWATNKLGKSSSQTLTISTKEPETKATQSSTAAIAGSVSSLVTIISVVSIAFLLYKRRYQKKTADRSNLGKSFDNGCEMNAHSDGDIPVKREPVYEGLKPTNERGYVEVKEQTYDTLEQKQDSSVTKDPVYTNLTLCHTSTTAKTRVT